MVGHVVVSQDLMLSYRFPIPSARLTNSLTFAPQVTYNPREVTYEQLLDTFFNFTDPTTLNRQGNDTGAAFFGVNTKPTTIMQDYKPVKAMCSIWTCCLFATGICHRQMLPSTPLPGASGARSLSARVTDLQPSRVQFHFLLSHLVYKPNLCGDLDCPEVTPYVLSCALHPQAPSTAVAFTGMMMSRRLRP